MDEGARRAKIAALVLLGLGIAFSLLFTIGEMAGGDVAGIQHLPPAVVLVGLVWLAWKRPTVAGIVLLMLAVPLGTAYVVVLVVHDLPLTWALERIEDERAMAAHEHFRLAASLDEVPALIAALRA